MNRPLVIQGFATHLPAYRRTQEFAFEWLAAAHARSAATEAGQDSLLPKFTERMNLLVHRYSCSPEHIGWRRTEIGDFTHTDWPAMQIFNLHENPRGRGIEPRGRLFAEIAERVVDSLFSGDREPPSDLLHVSCTGYVSPSAIQRLIEKKNWNTRTQATQVYHMGCYASIPALRVAAGLMNSGFGRRRAEIVHNEICSLHFDPGNHIPDQWVIQSLFADGHIRYSIAPIESRNSDDPGFEILSVLEEIVPGSLESMTWAMSDWGFRMTLSRDVPAQVAAALPPFLTRLFCHAGLNYDDEAGHAVFAIHPGGPRILDSVEELLGLQRSQSAASRAVLFERGNMSSATLPHIWTEIAADASIRPGTLLASLAFGPGLTVAGALFRKC
jgi:predicted naringenin-chalcone synthase